MAKKVFLVIGIIVAVFMGHLWLSDSAHQSDKENLEFCRKLFLHDPVGHFKCSADVLLESDKVRNRQFIIAIIGLITAIGCGISINNESQEKKHLTAHKN
jgi:hypothetical protein